ncbi:hypothetical protein OEW28_16330 [Defluviimonas sp. WL0002]|uniref:Sulfotransferase family protein n=1 Tax=Albidovulum marisflavi TaxID=2984159 RepID=A0ABT2ZGM8_9RHOB|nr:hypothetical protein [Defluviimonas sp. WL0002]MCV2870198.1 hypothetical protein [Defluviimonas sp. WL0002]
MQVIYHIGAHCTDEGRILKALLKNRGLLVDRGVAVPSPAQFRPVLRRAMQSLSGGLLGQDAGQMIIEDLLDGTPASRLIFSHDFLMSIPMHSIGEDGLYANAPRNVAALSRIFAEGACEFHIGLRNPATLVPALVRMQRGQSYRDVMGAAHPLEMRWRPVIERIFERVPDARLVLWCDEDLPFVWPELLRRMADLNPEIALEGENDFLATLLTPAGLATLESRLSTAPRDIESRRAITAEVLAAHLREGAAEEAIELPGWSQTLIDQMTAEYDADVAAIASFPRVEFLWP